MFNSEKIYKEYGISGLIMPYFWLLIYIYFHYKFIGLWFNNPTFVDYISLIVHVVLTLIAIVFSHQVLMWAAKQKENGKVASAFSAIIRKMADSPIEVISSVIEPITNEEYETNKKIAMFIFYLLYTLISIFFGYVIFIIVALIHLLVYLMERNK